jgi:hypothetical protein
MVGIYLLRSSKDGTGLVSGVTEPWPEPPNVELHAGQPRIVWRGELMKIDGI